MALPSPVASATPRGSSPLLPPGGNRDSTKSAAGLSHKIQLQSQHDANSPIPQVSLHKFRFLMVVIFGVGVVAAGLASLLNGLPIEKNVGDLVGTSTLADSRVELFQAVNGFVWAAIGLLLEEYFKIFFAVMLIFFANHKWSPNDNVTDGPTRFKVATLFWFTPLMMYVLNVGLSSVFIEHKATYTARGLADADLVNDVVAVTTLAVGDSDRTSVVNTVLRSAVNGGIVPFTLDPKIECAVTDVSKQTASANDLGRTVFLPKISDLQSTSADFGFKPRPWYVDAMPFSLKPTLSVKIARDIPTIEADLASFLNDANVEYETLIDMMIQGLTTHGKITTDSNSFRTEGCKADAEGPSLSVADLGRRTRSFKHDRRRSRRKLQASTSASASGSSSVSGSASASASTSGSTAGDSDTSTELTPEKELELAICSSAGNYIDSITRVTDEAEKTAMKLLDSMTTLNGVSTENASFEIETYQVSALVNLTMITIDLPFEDDLPYHYIDSTICDVTTESYLPDVEKPAGMSEADFRAQEERDCSTAYVYFDQPYQQCGEKNCILDDNSGVLQLNKQITATPFMVNCDPVEYSFDASIFAYLPTNCVPLNNSMFLYGFGSYFTGSYELRGANLGPKISNPRRHHKLTFAKLDWKFEDLTRRFDADCHKDAGSCTGMIHALHNIKDPKSKPRVLILGEDSLPTAHLERTLRDPLPILFLRQPKFYRGKEEILYSTFEHLDYSRMDSFQNQSTLGLGPGSCSLYVDAYLKQIENNHFYIQDPRQVVYSAAIFYLFQDAAIKEVDSDDNVIDLSNSCIGKARMSGDLEKKEIRYSIPLPSVVSTAIGIAMVLIFMGIIIKWPRDAVKQTDETNPAAQYADVLIDDLYPERVHTRRLRLMDGSTVEMDEYATKRIVFRNVHAPDMPVVME